MKRRAKAAAGAFLTLALACTCAARAADPAPSKNDIVSSVGHVDDMDGASQIKLERQGHRIEVIKGMLLQNGDEISVLGAHAWVSLKINGRSSNIVLKLDQSMKVSGVTPASHILDVLASHLPEAIRLLFAPDRIHAIETRPHDNLRDAGTRLEACALLPSGSYFIATDAAELVIPWRGHARSVSVVRRDGSVEKPIPAHDSPARLALTDAIRQTLASIIVSDGSGRELEWKIAFADQPPLPPYVNAQSSQDAGDIRAFFHAMWLLGMDPRAPPPASAWRLEGFRRLIGLADHFDQARVVVLNTIR